LGFVLFIFRLKEFKITVNVHDKALNGGFELVGCIIG